MLFLLLAIPASLYLVFRQQELRGRAAPATTLAFDPQSVSKSVGESFTLTVNINTGGNSVSGAELHVQYEAGKLEAIGIDIASEPFLPVVLVNGTVNSGFAFITLGSQPNLPKTGTGKLATVTFRALASTGGGPTLVRFTTDTKVAGTGEVGNVLASQPAPASVTIGVPGPTATPTPTPSPTPTAAPTPTPTPRSGGGGGGIIIVTPTPTPKPTATLSATPTPAQVIVITPPPPAPVIPVTADITPTAVLTVSGLVLFFIGALALFAL
ncbi:hypothetical protein HYT17_02485 [Candidatus Microgenomates bacterium]|nr:hypothetical protein [Candidatus Microgenomates bacterium]